MAPFFTEFAEHQEPKKNEDGGRQERRNLFLISHPRNACMSMALLLQKKRK
jgi:hypothetical protein